ncbi:aconitate hydratase [Microbacter margulisiae]|uniref:Aconitate hydratase A n=1 Tax=Microbacter margulisiae TaxID=1350067 RepID=A0A7W5DS18_9PORP|nr:aconitate hydratase [Microbacter margulisiae]MBB3188021.1 aconitate hydratase [Microbacter margulisiae]
MKIDNFDLFYQQFKQRLEKVRTEVQRPLTLAEKVLYVHLSAEGAPLFRRGIDYATFLPDRVAMQDATAQMALLQFMNAGKRRTAVPSSVHCDHLITAKAGASVDLPQALSSNDEVYHFLLQVCQKYGIDFWQPGAGIIHQVVLENYAMPGAMMVGTDSHTPNAGGLGMIAIGVGGADAVDVMVGMPWELKMPQIIGVKLTGKLNGWVSPKDVILKLAGILTVKGATNAILEYFGDGVASLSTTGRATICNMGAEVGATTSIFPFDEKTADFLKATQRQGIAEAAKAIASELKADDAVLHSPEQFYDQVIEIDLNQLEPYINGPFTPDAAHPISEFVRIVKEKGYPEEVEVGLIGSCTNSSYEDLSRAASVARQAMQANLKTAAQFIVSPGSEQVRATAERDGLLAPFEQFGGVIMANACGPCIGQWKRQTNEPEKKNSIVSSFNRNFAKRADGNPNTYHFVTSPVLVTALTLAGRLTFNPMTDSLKDQNGNSMRLVEPIGSELPENGFQQVDKGCLLPSDEGDAVSVEIHPDSQRLQILQPFDSWDGNDLLGLRLLIKTQGKCTTDHISMAGEWLRFRGHLANISKNLLMGAVNSFNGKTNHVLNPLNGEYDHVSSVAGALKIKDLSSIVVAEDNYGEGSSREHAAMEPRYLGVKVILAKSFARIHETNLKKQGVLAITFANATDYDKVQENDTIDVLGLSEFTPTQTLYVRLHHKDGTSDKFRAVHTYNQEQIDWFKAGSALNKLKSETATEA